MRKRKQMNFKNQNKPGMVAHMPIKSAVQEAGTGGFQVQGQPREFSEALS